jgi:hypothetical protein
MGEVRRAEPPGEIICTLRDHNISRTELGYFLDEIMFAWEEFQTGNSSPAKLKQCKVAESVAK